VRRILELCRAARRPPALHFGSTLNEQLKKIPANLSVTPRLAGGFVENGLNATGGKLL
jgi:hypothetical protein